ncbi:UNVERIFIED_CONTAM: putative ribonuclease H protein [Sesamum calycinum]|uniref:Ribonuclease H protein n=1 Tax=Sesamum calycinum TaxID=2727403 RepID=A0AAW2JB44_9LAMI
MSNDLSLVLEFERGGLSAWSKKRTFHTTVTVRGLRVPVVGLTRVDTIQGKKDRDNRLMELSISRGLLAEYAQEDEAEAEGSKPRKAPVIHSIQWQPPPPGWMKVNTDGCSRGQPGPSSCGGIFRNCRGFVHGCFALSLGSGFAYQAEWVGV